MMWDHGYNGWGPWLGFLLMVVFVAAVIVAIVYLVRAVDGRGTTGMTERQSQVAPPPMGGQRPESPEDILKRRYAAGEIDRDEYLQKSTDLKDGG